MTRDLILEMTRLLTEVPGVSGGEACAVQVAEEMLSPMGTVEVSPVGSVCCTVCPGREGAPHIVLEAHLDQIGLIVSYLEEDGFLRVCNVGGFDRRLMPAAPVTIHAKSGDFAGVISSVPPHLADKDSKEKPLKIEDMLIDTCFSTERAKELFAPGDLITMDGRFTVLNEKYLLNHAMDNRIGCVAVIAAAQELHRLQPDCRVTVVLASMEETSGLGAATAAFGLAPDQAIIVDVTFGDGFGVPASHHGKMGAGPRIGISPAIHKAMARRFIELAKREGIPYQIEAMGGKTGTDTDGMAAARAGVRVGLLSIPLRNMHTVVETIFMDDVINTARLMVEYCKEGGQL